MSDNPKNTEARLAAEYRAGVLAQMDKQERRSGLKPHPSRLLKRRVDELERRVAKLEVRLREWAGRR